MSSKLGTLFSLIFIAFFVMLASDLITLQYLYNDLDAKSTSVAYIICKNKKVDDSLVETIKDRYNVELTCLSHCNALPGEIIDFSISIKYQPIFISKKQMTIAVKRQAIISYYG